MFAKAYEIVSKFTHPVIISVRFYDKTVECLHIPVQSGHGFRSKLATDSGRKWPPIPVDSDHFFSFSGIWKRRSDAG
jgi:hypothetical protein